MPPRPFEMHLEEDRSGGADLFNNRGLERLHKCGILGFSSITLTEKSQTHVPTSKVATTFKVFLGEYSFQLSLLLSLCYCAAIHSRCIGTEGAWICSLRLFMYFIQLNKKINKYRNWGSSAGIQDSPFQADVLATGCRCFMALSCLRLHCRNVLETKKLECKASQSLATPLIIAHFFCSENALVSNSSAAVSNSSSVSSRTGGRLPTPKLRALGGAQRTHHDLTTPIVGKKTFKCKAVFQEWKKKKTCMN